MFAVEERARSSCEQHLRLLIFIRDVLTVVAHRSRLVENIDPHAAQAVAELQVLVTVAGEAFIEASRANEILAPNRGIAGEKIEPRDFFSRGRVQMPARFGMIAFKCVLFEVSGAGLAVITQCGSIAPSVKGAPFASKPAADTLGLGGRSGAGS